MSVFPSTQVISGFIKILPITGFVFTSTATEEVDLQPSASITTTEYVLASANVAFEITGFCCVETVTKSIGEVKYVHS